MYTIQHIGDFIGVGDNFIMQGISRKFLTTPWSFSNRFMNSGSAHVLFHVSIFIDEVEAQIPEVRRSLKATNKLWACSILGKQGRILALSVVRNVVIIYILSIIIGRC